MRTKGIGFGWLAMVVFAVLSAMSAMEVPVAHAGQAGWLQAEDWEYDPSVDPGDGALRKSGFPWYDAKTSGPRAWPVPEMVPATSRNRDAIPAQKPIGQPGTMRLNTPSNGLLGLSLLTWGVIALFVAGLVALLIWGYTRIDAGQRKQAVEDDWDDLHERIHELPFEIEESLTGNFRSMAWQAFEQEDYARAIMLLFSYVLLMLDRRGFIRLQKYKTNREYFREVREHAELAQFYRQVMIPFERSFYGHHPLDRQTFLNCWNRLGEFESGVSRRAEDTVLTGDNSA